MSYSRLQPGINDLESFCKKNNLEYILKEWDYSSNNGLLPSEVTYGTKVSINWICDKNHTYQQRVNAKVSQKQGCPYCSGKKILPGFNDLESYCIKNNLKYILKEWSDKNVLRSSQVGIGGNKKYLWQCSKCGHEWRAALSNRIANHSGCPSCAGQVVIKGKNDLASQFPQIADEWDWEKNDKAPEEYASKSHKKVYWKCSLCGHRYQMIIQSRTDQNQGCSLCAKRLQTSFPEQAIFYYIKKHFPDAVNKCRTVLDSRFEIDIYIPSRKIGIEYDGAKWHGNSSDSDLKKYNSCKEKGIRLIRVSEIQTYNAPVISDKCILSNYNQGKKLKLLVPALEELFQLLGVDQHIDAEHDELRIRENYYELRSESAGELYPELLNEWNQEENGNITLFMLSPQDGATHYSWKCSKCGNVWKTTVYHRAIRGQGCRKCLYETIAKKISSASSQRHGSIAELCPDLINEWDYDRNAGIILSEVPVNSNIERWWICLKGHPSYPARVADRTQKNTGCPLCARNRSRKVLCIETGDVYDSIRQAKLSTGFTNIYQCVHGVQKTAGGYHWKFCDE